ncbi:hypothetical protein AB0D12_33045 [Streptomyces sp. NPDC048479]|uniref:hypothetical protein n=1 Tax=Streptomyces sp. NPDC048479 TaxID=3154725 RepID=UPI003419E7BC
MSNLAAAAPLGTGLTAPTRAWDERYGLRTATSRRHPIGKDTETTPEGEGIRYPGAASSRPAELLEALADRPEARNDPRYEQR